MKSHVLLPRGIDILLRLISLRLKMSASPIARQAIQPQGQAIPRRIQINDASQLPHDYSSTPGGTLYSTTPGGNHHHSPVSVVTLMEF